MQMPSPAAKLHANPTPAIRHTMETSSPKNMPMPKATNIRLDIIAPPK